MVNTLIKSISNNFPPNAQQNQLSFNSSFFFAA